MKLIQIYAVLSLRFQYQDPNLPHLKKKDQKI